MTQGAPCPQSTNPTLPLPQDPPSAAVTQQNGMGLSAPAGQNCTVEEFLSGACLAEAVRPAARRAARSGRRTQATAPAQKSPDPGGRRLAARSSRPTATRARTFVAGGVRSFVRIEGDGEPVVLMHGLPASSFLYRKVLPELAGRGLQGVAFDLPGLGLADTPVGLRLPHRRSRRLRRRGGRRARAWARSTWSCTTPAVRSASSSSVDDPDAIRSLTILNTMVEIPKRPFPGEIWARLASGRGRCCGRRGCGTR